MVHGVKENVIFMCQILFDKLEQNMFYILN